MNKYHVLGPRILVRPLKLEDVDDIYGKVKKAGLAIPRLDEKRREEAAIDQGVVISIGALAWKDWGDGTTWVKEGDRIMWARHAGKVVHFDDKTEDRLVIINDEDVICKVEA